MAHRLENMSDSEQTAVPQELNFTRPSITKIARKAGVKSLADECFVLVDTLMMDSIETLVREGLLVNRVRGGKVLTVDDVQAALMQRGEFRTSGEALAFSKV